MKTLALAALAVSAAAVALPAAAQIGAAPEMTGAYAELGYKRSDVNDANLGAVTGRLGWRFHPNFGLEGEVDWGVSDGDRVQNPTSPTPVPVQVEEKWAASAYGVGYLPLSPRADVFARAGFGMNKYKLSPATTGFTPYDVDTNGFKYGLGAQYFFDGSNGVRADWTHFQSGHADDIPGYFGGKDSSNEWAVTFTHRFGGM